MILIHVWHFICDMRFQEMGLKKWVRLGEGRAKQWCSVSWFPQAQPLGQKLHQYGLCYLACLLSRKILYSPRTQPFWCDLVAALARYFSGNCQLVFCPASCMYCFWHRRILYNMFPRYLSRMWIWLLQLKSQQYFRKRWGWGMGEGSSIVWNGTITR